MKLIATIKHSWPVGLVSLPFGAICYFLLCYFTESIEAASQLRGSSAGWGGIESLFAMNAGVLGWVGVAVLEHRIVDSKMFTMLVTSCWCLVAIIGGFTTAATKLGGLTNAMWEMLVVSLVCFLGACAIRSYAECVR